MKNYSHTLGAVERAGELDGVRAQFGMVVEVACGGGRTLVPRDDALLGG